MRGLVVATALTLMVPLWNWRSVNSAFHICRGLDQLQIRRCMPNDSFRVPHDIDQIARH
jgi:hypothetical protein